MLDFLQLFDLVVNNTTSTFSPEETEICGVEYVYIFRANTPTNLTLFFPSSDELASEKLPALYMFVLFLWAVLVWLQNAKEGISGVTLL